MQSCLPKRGISILEVVVILVVIAVLVILILPEIRYFNHGDHENARQSKCMSNMRQLSLAMIMAAQDNNETMPAADEWIMKSGVTGDGIFDCPGNNFKGSIRTPDYMYVAAFFHNQHGLLSKHKLGDIKDTSLTPMLVELANPGKAGQTSYVSDAIEINPGIYRYDPWVALYHKIDRTRHGGSSIIAFVDGHVEFLAATFSNALFLNSMTAHEPILKR